MQSHTIWLISTHFWHTSCNTSQKVWSSRLFYVGSHFGFYVCSTHSGISAFHQCSFGTTLSWHWCGDQKLSFFTLWSAVAESTPFIGKAAFNLRRTKNIFQILLYPKRTSFFLCSQTWFFCWKAPFLYRLLCGSVIGMQMHLLIELHWLLRIVRRKKWKILLLLFTRGREFCAVAVQRIEHDVKRMNQGNYKLINHIICMQ